MTGFEVDISFLFVIAVILIWFTIAYQFVLTVFGYINCVRSLREKRDVDKRSFDYPSCSILIPAHNEEKVIGRTIESMLHLEYPKDKLQIIVINDGSKDTYERNYKPLCIVRCTRATVRYTTRRRRQREIPNAQSWY